MAKRVTILGSTGSVGVSTLDLLAQTGVEVELAALTAGRNVTLLAEQALKWRPDAAVIADESLLPELEARLSGSGVKAKAGRAAIVEAAGGQGADWVMAAIVGVAGLEPTLAAARAGAVVALANKESLVCAGPALLKAAKAAGGAVIPVDSEHSAIFQCLQPNWSREVSRLILTASGGPFRDWSTEQMAHATPEQAIAHPNWSMGAKISVDCATLMNKSLEMIEAAYLFETGEDRIDVLVHRQSVIHSMVEYADGSTLAQLGPPDMRAPIAYAFAWPDRIAWPAQRLDLAAVGSLTFEAPDPARFPSLDLARHALRAGGGAPAAFNAANETAVARFLDRKIGFLDIVAAVAETLERMDAAGDLQARGEQETADGALEFALSVDGRARQVAAEATERLAQVV